MYKVKPIFDELQVKTIDVMYKVPPIFPEALASKDVDLSQLDENDIDGIIAFQEDLLKRLSALVDKISALPLPSSESLLVIPELTIHIDVQHKPSMLTSLISHVTAHCDAIEVKTHIHNTAIDAGNGHLDPLLSLSHRSAQQPANLKITLIVSAFGSQLAWLNHQPYLVFDVHNDACIYGEVNVIRHLIRSLPDSKLSKALYPSQNSAKIDDTLKSIQSFLFSNKLNDHTARNQLKKKLSANIKPGKGVTIDSDLGDIIIGAI